MIALLHEQKYKNCKNLFILMYKQIQDQIISPVGSEFELKNGTS